MTFRFLRAGLTTGLSLMVGAAISGAASAYTLTSLGDAGGWDDINKKGPITTVIDEFDYTNDVANTGSITGALMNAYATWSGVPDATNLKFAIDQNTDSANNYDAFDGNGGEWFNGSNNLDQQAEWRYANIVMGGWLPEEYFLNLGSSNILAVTWTGRLTGDGSRKPAWHSEIFFNDGFAWSVGADNCEVENPLYGTCFDIETVFLHELGHAIGFGHEDVNNDAASVMLPSYGSIRTELSKFDMAGAVALYGGGGGGGGGGGKKGRRPNALEGDFFIVQAPEPATLAIFGLGLAGMGLMRRRRVR